MIIDRAELTSLLTETLDLVDAPPGCGAVLEGSIAEGFGNSASDVDFLLLADDDHDHPTMPTIVFVRGRRVEVRTRSLRQVRAQADAVCAHVAAGFGALPAALLDRCQRLRGAVVLRGEDVVRRAREWPLSLPEVVAGWYAHHSRQAMRHAVASHVLGEEHEALAWAGIAARHAAKSWVAARGETYLEPKWLDQQFDRLAAGGDAEAIRLRERLAGLRGGQAGDAESARPPDEPVRPYDGGWAGTGLGEAESAQPLDEHAALVADFGVDGCAADPEQVLLGLRAGVTTWPIGDRLHVVRDRADVFVLDAPAGRAWRSIAPGRPVGEVLRRAPGPAASALAEFHRIGLVELLWRDGGPIASAQPWAPAEPVTPPPSTRMPVLGLAGAAADGHVALVPLPAKRFAAAGMAQVWSHIMIENAREDLSGALDGGQREVARTSGLRLLHHACRALLSACGMSPLPPDAAIVARLGALTAVPAELTAQAAAVERELAGDEWELWAERLDKLVAGVRDLVRAEVFPASFDSAAAWEATLRIGHDWIRLGAYLDADFPIEEARDLLTSGGAQPHRRGGG
ncbi:hypothetical protein SAMN04488074_102127 [Lentzea albidocapillata subsp. violacea]|uniref:Nucleotidyltransferase domain-containing protein n=1 Tax=Lentzea albidocapillata subsp. violacea TaxID=128104 RepID=A0A1G8TYD3_9PSEU|nr:hypothetical protein [Lentzea albidocapillata]SDJ46558.1 hypothetical protein SAMN04488074_102127 [Lentzea albidocapillata subsp. violacea]